MSTQPYKQNDVLINILDHAQRMLQTRGYHGFSYSDIATEVGIRKASIHYYFPHKEDLALRLVIRYREALRKHVAWIDQECSAPSDRLVTFVHMFRDIVRSGFPQDGGRICLCASLTTDLLSLPIAVRDEVCAFFAEHELWLTNVLESGRRLGCLNFEASPSIQAQGTLAGLQGAMLLARASGDANKYCDIAQGLLRQLGIEVASLR